MAYLAIAAGAALGANLRYLVGLWVADRFGTELPYGTFIVNVSGCFAIGIVMAIVMQRMEVDPIWRLLLVTGFLGGYTTFSSYAWETLRLADTEGVFAALMYVAASTVIGIGAAAVGVVVVRALTR